MLILVSTKLVLEPLSNNTQSLISGDGPCDWILVESFREDQSRGREDLPLKRHLRRPLCILNPFCLAFRL
jgi:hypothetical protein